MPLISAVHILSLLITVVALYLAYQIYKFNRMGKGWLTLVFALILVIIRRGIVLATYWGYFPNLGSKIVEVDSVIFLVTIALYSFGLWTMYRSFKTFDIVERKSREKIKVFNKGHKR